MFLQAAPPSFATILTSKMSSLFQAFYDKTHPWKGFMSPSSPALRPQWYGSRGRSMTFWGGGAEGGGGGAPQGRLDHKNS